MLAYSVIQNKVIVRDNSGDLFAFAPAVDGREPALRLVEHPRWKAGICPKDGEVRVDLARGAARGIARDNGLIQ